MHKKLKITLIAIDVRGQSLDINFVHHPACIGCPRFFRFNLNSGLMFNIK